MKIYDETSRDEIFDPDLTKGYLYDGTIVTGRTEERYNDYPSFLIYASDK